ncbi:hypothetical protein PVAND_016314 [Polypedilum vanderplanki]|uniref:Cystinosin homolog n=1 Tax=Polypedilum vanderplanki TaxID=319348 RepID=A0A9J6BF33_POLVA|nr:hypothetical protein PVAND_016314 [Polypedilum vanderplanki]
MKNYFVTILVLFCCFYEFHGADLPSFELSTDGFTLIVGESEEIRLSLNSPVTRAVTFNFETDRDEIITLNPKSFTVLPSVPVTNQTIKVETHKAGKVEVDGHATPVEIIDDFNLFFRIVVANSRPLIIISSVVGWIYFVAWSVSFYPQVWLNFKRKSVVGLSFDFLALNIVGHTLYAVFNSSLYFIKYFQDEYFVRFPHGLNPVELNDVFFSIHASVLTFLTICQCFYYESGTQRVSKISWSIIGIFTITALVIIILCSIGNLHWLDFLYTCSYIKLAVTLTKYVPQAFLNYKRKSTVGWSIENILLDFTGGILSMLQMIFNSYNYNDWASIFGDPTKFGLGLFSVLFDIVFIVQHYVLYKDARHQKNNDNNTTEVENTEVTIEPEDKEKENI